MEYQFAIYIAELLNSIGEMKHFDIVAGAFITSITTVSGAYFAFSLNRRQNATRELIVDYFSKETLASRLLVHRVMAKYQLSGKRIKYTELTKKVEEYAHEPENKNIYGYLDPDLVHVCQFFERLIISYEKKLINRSLIWSSLARHIRYWYYEFFEKIEYDQPKDARYDNAIDIGKRLEKIIIMKNLKNFISVVIYIKETYIHLI